MSTLSKVTPSETPRRPCECGRGEASGIPVGDRVVWSRCEACQKDVAEAEEAAKRERERSARVAAIEARAARVKAHFERIGVPRKYRTVTLDDFIAENDPDALAAARGLVRRYRAGHRESLYLFSTRPAEKLAPGNGKTTLAAGIIRALALDMDTPLEDIGYAFVPKLLMEIQATFKHPERSELEVVEKYARPEVLVWDDFGAEKLSDYASRTLFTLLYDREGKVNIYTSNLSLDQIEGRDPSGYTSRITSRIAGESRIVRLTGPDRRTLRAA